MWKCKTCDKVNDDKLEICWGCYTPKRNNYIELGDTDVTASFDDLQKKDSKHSHGIKITKPFIAFLIANIPFVALTLYVMYIGLAFNGDGYGKGPGDATPIVFVLFIFSIFGLWSIIEIIARTKTGYKLGLMFYSLTSLVTGTYLMFAYAFDDDIFIASGLVLFLCAIFCVYFLLFDYPDLIEK